jgi:hypothetical protein
MSGVMSSINYGIINSITSCILLVFLMSHTHLREEVHDKQLPQELQYIPHKIIFILSVLFYPIILCNFNYISDFILYPSALKIIYVNYISYLKTL